MNLTVHLGHLVDLRLVLFGIAAPIVATLVAAILCRCCWRASASTRHLIWLLAFVAMAVCLPITVFQVRVAVPIFPAASPVLAEPGAFAVAAPQVEVPARRAIPWSGILAGVWLAGFLTLPLMFVAGNLRLRRIIKGSTSVADPSVADLWEELLLSSGIRVRVRLFASAEVALPLAAGLFRPVVIVPEAALNWPASTLRAALIHELAHLARRDLWCSAFARTVASFYWFNPLAWRALRALQAEAEMAADDCVVVSQTEPVDYATALVTLARTLHGRRATPVSAIGMLRGGDLQARLESILDPARQRRAPRGIVRWAAMLGAILVTACALVLRLVAVEPLTVQAAELPGVTDMVEQPFAPKPFRLQVRDAKLMDATNFEKNYGRIPILPEAGIDYGIPLIRGEVSSGGFNGSRYIFNVDLPGPGYRAQRDMRFHRGFPRLQPDTARAVQF